MSGNGGKFLATPLIGVGAITLAGAFLFFPAEAVLIALSVVTLCIYVLLLVTRRLSYVLIIWLLALPFFSPNQLVVKTALDLGAGNMSPDRLVFVFLIMLFFAQVAFKQHRVLSFSRIEMMTFVFCSIVLISLEMHGNLERNKIGVMATRYLFPILAYFLTKNLLTTENDVRLLIWALFGLGIYLSVTACCEFFSIEGLIFPRYITNANIGDFPGRARGPFLQPATNGTVMGIILLVSLYLYAGMTSWSKRLLIMMSAGLMLVGVLFSLTRGAWLGTAVGLLLMCIFQHAIRRVVVLAIVIAAVSLPLILLGTSQFEHKISTRAEDSGTASFRYNTWQTGVLMFLKHPIFGIGFMRYDKLHHLYETQDWLLPAPHLKLTPGAAAHNTYIEIAAELGLIGLVPYFTILFWLLTMSIKLYRALPPVRASARSFVILYWGAASAFLISSFFYTQNSMFLTSMLLTFGGIIDRWSALQAMPEHISVQGVRSISRTVVIS